jgi:DNA-directed RNA polymerase specialized sigma24 family protein
MTDPLTTSQLIEHCQAEAQQYRQTRQSDSTYCFALFRRALAERDQAAWSALYRQYQPLVTYWVSHYARFSATGEAAELFVNEAFARFWLQAAKPDKIEAFSTVGAYLTYLHLCAHSAVEKHLRRQQKDALFVAAALPDELVDHHRLEDETAREVWLAEVAASVAEIIQGERERMVAEASWVYGLPPRQIQVMYPEQFATVAEVSQVKRNLVERLQRHARLKKLLE